MWDGTEHYSWFNLQCGAERERLGDGSVGAMSAGYCLQGGARGWQRKFDDRRRCLQPASGTKDQFSFVKIGRASALTNCRSACHIMLRHLGTSVCVAPLQLRQSMRSRMRWQLTATLRQAEDQATTAGGAMPVSGDRRTIIRHRFVAFFNDVWFYARVLRA
jgi:hypothetical protein